MIKIIIKTDSTSTSPLATTTQQHNNTNSNYESTFIFIVFWFDCVQ